MSYSIGFSPTIEVEDRDPAVLDNDGYTHRGKPFLTKVYRGIPDVDDLRQDEDGKWEHIPVTRWRWFRSGLVLNNDGQPRKDRAHGSLPIKESQVPAYVKETLLAEMRLRAEWVSAEIVKWIDEAEEVLDRATSKEGGKRNG